MSAGYCLLGCPPSKTYYSFPSSVNDKQRRKLWLEFFGMKDRYRAHFYACERHFSSKQISGGKMNPDGVPDVPTHVVRNSLKLLNQKQTPNSLNLSAKTMSINLESSSTQTHTRLCGSVQISEFLDEYRLNCFYCDDNFLLEKWQEFTDHLKEQHFEKEQAFKLIRYPNDDHDYTLVGSRDVTPEPIIIPKIEMIDPDSPTHILPITFPPLPPLLPKPLDINMAEKLIKLLDDTVLNPNYVCMETVEQDPLAINTSRVHQQSDVVRKTITTKSSLSTGKIVNTTHIPSTSLNKNLHSNITTRSTPQHIKKYVPFTKSSPQQSGVFKINLPTKLNTESAQLTSDDDGCKGIKIKSVETISSPQQSGVFNIKLPKPNSDLLQLTSDDKDCKGIVIKSVESLSSSQQSGVFNIKLPTKLNSELLELSTDDEGHKKSTTISAETKSNPRQSGVFKINLPTKSNSEVLQLFSDDDGLQLSSDDDKSKTKFEKKLPEVSQTSHEVCTLDDESSNEYTQNETGAQQEKDAHQTVRPKRSLPSVVNFSGDDESEFETSMVDDYESDFDKTYQPPNVEEDDDSDSELLHPSPKRICLENSKNFVKSCLEKTKTETNESTSETTEFKPTELVFEFSPREVIMDLLENIKENPILWEYHKERNNKDYAKTIIELCAKMNDKWSLRLNLLQMRFSINRVLIFYRYMLPYEKVEHFDEYFYKCLGFLPSSEYDIPRQRCIYCDICCETDRGMRKHLVNQHGSVQWDYRCEQCSERFRLSHEYELHKRLPHYTEIYRCKICLAKFKLRQSFKRHILLHKPKVLTTTTRVKCKICSREYKDQKALSSHVYCFHKERRFKCHLCHKLFLRDLELQIHIKRHLKQKDFICDVCGKGFVKQPELDDHMDMHTGTKITCRICNLKLRKGSLSRHLRLVHHAYEGTIETTFREKGYNYKRYDPSSSNVSSEPQPRQYACKKCNIHFDRLKELKDHNQESHANVKMVSCKICQIELKYRTSLKRHYREKHKLSREKTYKLLNNEDLDEVLNGEDEQYSYDNEIEGLYLNI